MIKRKEILQILFLTAVMFLTLSIDANAANCTAISRTNNGANAVLTSSKYNADHNTAYTGLNAIINTTCTLPLTAINPTDIAPLLDAPKLGCKLSIADTNTISVDKCRIGVDGTLTQTSAATTVTWGCTSCSSEIVDTFYYVYALNTSTATTLNLLISTTAPNADGYDSSDNRALGRFFNNNDSDIVKVADYDQMVKPISLRPTEIIYLKDYRAQGTNGGNCTGGVWNDKPLSHVETIDGSTDTVDLSNDYFTLQAGNYLIEATAPAADVAQHRLGLFNNTTSNYDLVGTSSHNGDGATLGGADVGSLARLEGFLNLGSASLFRFRHWCNTAASGTYGLGRAANITGISEQYLSVKITKYE